MTHLPAADVVSLELDEEADCAVEAFIEETAEDEESTAADAEPELELATLELVSALLSLEFEDEPTQLLSLPDCTVRESVYAMRPVLSVTLKPIEVPDATSHVQV